MLQRYYKETITAVKPEDRLVPISYLYHSVREANTLGGVWQIHSE